MKKEMIATGAVAVAVPAFGSQRLTSTPAASGSKPIMSIVRPMKASEISQRWI